VGVTSWKFESSRPHQVSDLPRKPKSPCFCRSLWHSIRQSIADEGSMHNGPIRRGGTHSFSCRVPAKRTRIVDRKFWRKRLWTSHPVTARKAALQVSADCERAIAVATLECRRQRGTIVRLIRDGQEVLDAAGGSKVLRKAMIYPIAGKHGDNPADRISSAYVR
jgi:hypothetical protein